MARQVNDNLDPTLLADLDSEADYARTTQRRKFMPRIKIERGQALLLRFLPVEIGTNKGWFGRFAQHWVHKRAVFCRKNTSEHLGGDRNYDCPICRMIENGLHHQNKSVVKRAEECFAEARWFGVVLPLSKDMGKGQPVQIPEPDCVTAHEFHMYRTMFEKLRFIASRFAIKGTQGIVDIGTGQDIWVQRTGKGYEFQPAGAAPLWGKDEDPKTVLEKIWATIIMPDISMPDREQETEFFHKIKDYLLTGGGSFDNTSRGGGSRGGRGGGYDAPENNDLDQDGGMPALPSRGGRGMSAPATTDTSLDAPPIDAASLDDPGMDSTLATPPAPAPRPAPVAPPVQHSAQTAPVAAPTAPVAPPTPPPPALPVSITPPPVAPPAPPRVTVPGSKLIPPPVRTPRATSSAQPPPVTTPAAPPIAGATPDDEIDGVAPEHVDAAPPIAEVAEPAPVVESTPAPQAPPAPPVPPVATAPQAPPPVKAGGTRLAASLTSRLAQFQAKTPPVAG